MEARLLASRASAVGRGFVGALDAFGPGPGVLAVVGLLTGFAHLERSERVDHDRQLVEVLDPDRLLRRTRLRPVRMPTGVDRDGALADARSLARLVVTVHVEHDLVAVDVRVVVR